MKEDSFSKIEKLRKPISWTIVVFLLLSALLTVPKGFGNAAHESMEFLGFALLITAGIGRIWCLLYIAGRKDEELCTEGPYSICRNPLYLFSFIGLAGASLALQSLLFLVVSSTLYLVYYHYVIRSEENRLSHLFGVPFTEYARMTPRFFPKFSNYSSPQSERVTSTKIIERGLREVVWFFAMIVIIDGLELLHQSGILVIARLPG